MKLLKFIDYVDGLTVHLAPQGGIPDQAHLFEEKEVKAINAALAAGRPLLVRGDPGTGKSQLARAAAKALGREYLQMVVDSQTESRDLMWSFDAVGRLGEAQLSGALGRLASEEDIRERLAVTKFVRPGPLWWAFDWGDAERQAKESNTAPPTPSDGGDPGNGCVLLIDEIDKAESEVPNGLLEVLGSGQMTPAGRVEPVRAGKPLPLVIITTNQERTLPDAFLRRCLVLGLALPKIEAEFVTLLTRRARVHFPTADEEVLTLAAGLVWSDREIAMRQQSRPFPGQAEYLDLLRAVLTLHPRSKTRQLETLGDVAEFTLKKYVTD
jgi:MoxR-like ATPase